jgi:ABC-2 type transport system ATP-binding protein
MTARPAAGGEAMPDIITVHELTKRFGTFTAVDRISFGIRQGEVLGFLGPNGAGKTTTIKMILGLLQITSGRIVVNGLDAQKNRRRVKNMFGYMSQKFSLYATLTSIENIDFFGGIAGLSSPQIRERQREIAALIPEPVLRQKIKDIPPGIRQKVALHTALLADPDILMLEEPTSGVDPEVRRQFWLDIYHQKGRGKTILVTTHNLDEAEFADRLLIIHAGAIVLQGEPQELLRSRGADSIETIFKDAIQSHETH